MRSLLRLALVLAALTLAPAGPARAATGSTFRIAAVVNDDVITVFDVRARMKLFLASANLPDTAEMRQRAKDAVMRRLVNERLKLQEAGRMDISISDSAIDKGLRRLEEQNGMPPGGLERFLAARGIPKSAIKDQVRAKLAWSRVVGRKLRSRVSIGPDAVDAYIKRVKENQGTQQHRVAEIVLPVDQASERADVRATARRLVEELRGGANFASLARQVSQSASAARGGNLGWVRPDQLAPALEKALGRMDPGDVSDPIRTLGGYTILALKGRREARLPGRGRVKFTLAQLTVPVPANAGDTLRKRLRRRAEAAARNAKACDGLKAQAETLREEGIQGAAAGRLGTLKATDLSEKLRGALMPLVAGGVTGARETERGFRVVMVCDRQDPEGNPVREAVRKRLLRERLNKRAQKYLRELRRKAFIDVRL